MVADSLTGGAGALPVPNFSPFDPQQTEYGSESLRGRQHQAWEGAGSGGVQGNMQQPGQPEPYWASQYQHDPTPQPMRPMHVMRREGGGDRSNQQLVDLTHQLGRTSTRALRSPVKQVLAHDTQQVCNNVLVHILMVACDVSFSKSWCRP
jgi:hypothetical protein